MQTKKIPKKKTAAKSAPAKVKNEKRSKEGQASEKAALFEDTDFW